MSSRKEQKEQLRAEREARERAAAEAARRKRMYGYVAAGVLLAAVVVALAFVLLSGDGGSDPGSTNAEETREAGESAGDFPSGTVPPPRIPTLEEAAEAAGCTAESQREEGNSHVQGTVDYDSEPPHSGDHFEVAAVDDAYTEAPPTEQLVHSLEHGRIIYWYRPGIPDELLGSLKALYDEDPAHVLIAPRQELPAEVAASAWTETLTCERAKAPEVWDALRAFRDRHRDRGPENVP